MDGESNSSIEGFRKVDPDRWEFAHDSFLRGQKQLLTCIRRRRPNYHQGREQGAGNSKGLQGLNEGEDAIVEEIAQLKEEQESIDKDMEELKRRLDLTEQRPHQMISFLSTVVSNPNLIAQMLQKRGSLSGGKKRRRVPYKEETEGLMAELGIHVTADPVISNGFNGSELIDGADCSPKDPNLIDSEVRSGLLFRERMGTCALTDQHSGVSIDESGILNNAAEDLGDCNVEDILCWDEDLSDETEFANCNVIAEIALIAKSP